MLEILSLRLLTLVIKYITFLPLSMEKVTINFFTEGLNISYYYRGYKNIQDIIIKKMLQKAYKLIITIINDIFSICYKGVFIFKYELHCVIKGLKIIIFLIIYFISISYNFFLLKR